MRPQTTTLALATAFTLATSGAAQQVRTPANYIIVPQSRAFALESRTKPVRIETVSARIRILEQTAETTLEITIRNPSARQEEAVLLLPVPSSAAVSGFTFQGQAKEPTARLLSREEARRTYNSIVSKLRDPALLEFAGHNLVRSSVFPLPAGGTQRIKLTYEHVLEADGNRIDYVLPRSESLERRAKWQIHVSLQSKRPVSMVYSPSHHLEITRRDSHRFDVKLNPNHSSDPGAFRLSYLLQQGDGMTASLFAYPDPKIGGGYFLLIASPPKATDKTKQKVRREVTVVIDRSGSMSGPKIDQARASALQIIDALDDGEAFNIIDYSTTVAKFVPRAVLKNSKTRLQAHAYLKLIRPGGGTNIHDALVESMRPGPIPGMLPIILFLTDGLPTVGQTAEAAIRDSVTKGNVHNRRIFTFGVGHDVNVPLLDRIAEQTRATASYVLPEEDVEIKVSKVFRKLYGPTLSEPTLISVTEAGKPDTRRIREVQPAALSDLFENDDLVVLGQYRGDAPLNFHLTGKHFGKAKRFSFGFDLNKASTRNAFVPRLWATRQIAHLVDMIRQAGAAPSSVILPTPSNPFKDPRMLELRDEIMRLSTQFGVLSEYTSFLATEGTKLGNWNALTKSCETLLHTKAINVRWGMAAVNQGFNINDAKIQSQLNPRNSYVNDKLQRVEVSNVLQICDRAFFKQGPQWIDGRLLAANKFTPSRTIALGSPAYQTLLELLISQGRQGTLSLRGDLLLQVNGEVIKIQNH